jgi:hypothetical protein
VQKKRALSDSVFVSDFISPIRHSFRWSKQTRCGIGSAGTALSDVPKLNAGKPGNGHADRDSRAHLPCNVQLKKHGQSPCSTSVRAADSTCMLGTPRIMNLPTSQDHWKAVLQARNRCRNSQARSEAQNTGDARGRREEVRDKGTTAPTVPAREVSSPRACHLDVVTG